MILTTHPDTLREILAVPDLDWQVQRIVAGALRGWDERLDTELSPEDATADALPCLRFSVASYAKFLRAVPKQIAEPFHTAMPESYVKKNLPDVQVNSILVGAVLGSGAFGTTRGFDIAKAFCVGETMIREAAAGRAAQSFWTVEFWANLSAMECSIISLGLGKFGADDWRAGAKRVADDLALLYIDSQAPVK